MGGWGVADGDWKEERRKREVTDPRLEQWGRGVRFENFRAERLRGDSRRGTREERIGCEPVQESQISIHGHSFILSGVEQMFQIGILPGIVVIVNPEFTKVNADAAIMTPT